MANYEENKPTYTQSKKVGKLYTKMNKATKKKPGKYKESKRVTELYGNIKNVEDSRPGEYQSRFSDKLDGVLDGILNREEFSYDMNTDPLYQQYKEQYTQQGQKAMLDTMGNAAALSGGYGNSYASTAGSQAYQGYMNQLNDRSLDLYQLAYQKYQDQGANMYNQAGLLQSMDEVDYGRHRDTVGDWQNDRDYYTGLYQNERNFDYGKHQDKWSRYYENRDYYTGLYQNERDFDYGQHKDALSQWNNDRSYGYQKDYDAQQQANWAQEFAYRQQKDAEDKAYQYAALANRNASKESTEEKGKSYKGTGGSSTAPLSTNAINGILSKTQNMSTNQGTQYIAELYNQGKITLAQANALIERNAKATMGSYQNTLMQPRR